MSILLDGTLADWAAGDRLETPQTAVAGYELYGRLEGDTFYFALRSAVPVGPSSTFWLNTDANTTTGYKVWDWAVGAEFNINFGGDGVPRLYTDGDGATLVGNVSYALSADGRTFEVAIPKSMLGAGVTSVGVMADINNTVYLPVDFTFAPYTIEAPQRFDGLVTDWTADQRLDTPANGISGYELYGKADAGDFVFGVKSAVAIGPNTTFWLNTDGDSDTGFQVFGFAAGAEFNVNIGADGVARLYTGSAGQTLVGEIDYTIAPDGLSMEFAVPKALVGASVAAVTLYADINDTVFLPTAYVNGGYVVQDAQAGSFDGVLTEWTNSERLDTPATAIDGYEFYGHYADGNFIFAMKSEVEIGPNTTFWLNTDGNTATGHQIFGFAGGAEFNVNIGTDGIARLYTGDAGQTFVGTVDFAIGPDGKSIEFAVPKALIGEAVTSVGMLADVNDTVYLPGDFSSDPAYTVIDPASLPPDGTGQKVAIVFSQTTANNYFSSMAYSQLFMAAQSQAMAAGIPFDVIGEEDLTDLASLAQYDAIVFPSFRNVPENHEAIADTLKTLVYQYDVSLITAGDFMTNTAQGGSLPGNAYAYMQDLLGVTRTGGPNGNVTVTVQATAGGHAVTEGYGAGGEIHTYANVGTNYFGAVNPNQGSVTTIAEQVVGGQAHNAVVGSVTGGRNVHFATEGFLADSNLLGQALDWVRESEGGPTVSLHMSRNEAIVASRNDMDQSQETGDVDDGIYDQMLSILSGWKEQYDFVGSYYINVGINPPDQDTNWFLSSQYYQQLLAMGNEIGSHSFTHPSDTNFLWSSIETEADLDQMIANYAASEGASSSVVTALNNMNVASFNAAFTTAMAAPNFEVLSALQKAILETSYQFQFETARRIIEENLNISIPGAAVPGMPENLAAARAIIQYYDYLSGGASIVGGGYPGALGYLTDDEQEKVYLAPNMSFDFTLTEWLGLNFAQAIAKWGAEWDALSANSDLPIVVWPWHDYGVTAWSTDEQGNEIYSLEMFTSLVEKAYAAGAEFVTLADLAARIKAFEKADFGFSVNGDVITATAVPQTGQLGTFALNLDDLGGKTIANVTNWYAYDGDSVFLDADGGTFEINLGTAQADVTHITEINSRAKLMSLTGTGTDLDFTIAGEGKVVIDLKQTDGHIYEVTGAQVVSIVGDLMTLDLGAIGSHVVSVKQKALNATPTDITVSNLVALAENTAERIKIADLVVVDPDTTPELRLNVLTVSDARFEIDPLDGALYLKAGQSMDFEAEPQVVMTLTSTDGPRVFSKPLTLSVADGNDAPTDITVSNLVAVAENTAERTKIADLAVADADLDPSFRQNVVTVSDARFEIDPVDGALYLKAGQNLDFEAEPQIALTLTSTDGTRVIDKPITITVGNVNEAPTEISVSNLLAVAENTSVRTKIADLAVLDPDIDPALRQNVVTVSDARFEVDPADGALYLKAGQVFDFSSEPQIALTLTSSDGTHVITKPVTIAVTDVNSAPTDITVSNLVSLAENTAVRTKVADLAVVDPDMAAELRQNVLSVSDARFEVDPTDGGLYLKAGQSLDFEAGPQIVLTLTSTDGPRVFTKPLSITLTNVNEAPTGAVALAGTAIENGVLTADTSTLGDPDGLGTLSYQWQRDTGSGFADIGGATAASYQLGVADVAAQVRVVVSYTDAGGTAESVTSTASAPVVDLPDGAALGPLPEDTLRILTPAMLAGPGASISGLTATIGTLLTNPDGSWLYIPPMNADGSVTFSFTATTAAGSAPGTIDMDILPANDVIGTSRANSLAGAATSDNYHGLAGSDLIRGGGGNDLIFGDQGNEEAFGEDGDDVFVATVGDGADRYNGGAGIDTYDLGRTSATSSVNLANGTAMSTETLSDVLTSIENVVGGRGNDTITGSNAANRLEGGFGNDKLSGGGGADVLIGGHGNDRLTGGAGRDIVTGDAGNDVFIFGAVNETGRTATTRDVITDFESGVDRIDLSGMDANTAQAGNQAFTFLATEGAAFTGARGQLQWYQEEADNRTIIAGDTNGDRVADFHIELTGLVTPVVSDFLL